MTPNEKKTEQTRNIFSRTLLAHEQQIITLDTNSIAQGRVNVTHHDLLTHLSNRESINVNRPRGNTPLEEDIFFSLQFNMITQLQQLMFDPAMPSVARAEAEAIIQDFRLSFR